MPVKTMSRRQMMRAVCPGETDSIDPHSSANPPGHRIARSRDLPILENPALSAVEPGDFELIALSMELEGLDAAPVWTRLCPLRQA
ncbi:hypothetical protein [uncultured Roseibium sp.]|uniref:hypothetical protein n=1 Tax=uncultured Roseibium sp. TaxID=1936171 RepID=UPI00260FEF51|nr:hypothetical protein [uncultured Roseibium sp.]